MSEPNSILSAHVKYGLPLSFTRDGATLITGGFDGSISCWSVQDWSEIASMMAHDQSVNCGAITAENLVVTGSTDKTIGVFDADLSKTVRTLKGHTDTVAGLATHSSESMVASASYDTTVRVWKLESQTEPLVLKGHPNNVTSVEFLDRDDLLVSGGIGDELIVWTLDSETEETRLGGHGQAAAGVSLCRSDRLWSVGYNGTVYQWSTDDWAVLDSFNLPDDATPSGIAVDPVLETVAVTRDGGVLLYDFDGQYIAEHTTSIKGIYMPRWVPEKPILTVGGADGNVRIYNVER